MKYVSIVVALLHSVLCSPSALAGPDMECGVEAFSQIEIAECVVATKENVDRVLTEVFGFAQSAARELDSVTGRSVSLGALEGSQKSWLEYRENHCAFVGKSFGGGSGTSIAISSCKTTLTRARIQQLMAILN